MSTQILGVIATVNTKGNPEAALIALTETDTLELIFGTYKSSRKYSNLIQHPHVAVVFGHDMKEGITIQYQGIASEVTGSEMERCRELHITKNPHVRKHAEKPEQRWFKITPTWIRYSNLAVKPHEEFELTL